MTLHAAIEQPATSQVDRGGATPAERRCHVRLLCDDPPAALAWQRALQAEGIDTSRCGEHDADRAAEAIVLLVHGGLPPQLGRLRELRTEAPGVPLAVACSGLRELDQILALELGADDVLDPSLSAPVVAARLRALWRRQSLWQTLSRREAPRPRRLQFGALVLSLDQRRVTLDGAVVELTEGEFEVLWLLAGRRLHEAGIGGLQIETVRGLGYSLHARSGPPLRSGGTPATKQLAAVA